MEVINSETANSRYIPTRILKGTSYAYAQTYVEAGNYGIMAFNPDQLNIPDDDPWDPENNKLAAHYYTLEDDRISDFSAYSDNRIAVRSDRNLAVLSFDGEKFSTIYSAAIRSSINTGIACNSNFAFASCGGRIVSLDINTGKIAQEYRVPDAFYTRDLCCTESYLFVRKCQIDFKAFKLSVYRINNDYLTNPDGNISFIDEIDSPAFDLDLGRLTIVGSEVLETGLNSHRLVSFNGSALTVQGNLTPFYPALEFIRHGSYYFPSPDVSLKVLSRSWYTWSTLYESSTASKYPSYICPGNDIYEFLSSRDSQGDGLGRNVSRNTIVP